MTLHSVEEALGRHSSDFIEAYIYGSVAGGTSDEYSDVDVVLIRETDLPFFERIKDVMGLRREFSSLDLLIYTPDEMREILSEPGRWFLKNLMQTGHRIEGKQKRS